MKVPWSTSELRALRENADRGAEHVAAILGRSVSSVQAAARRNRVSLRRDGETRGTLMGQPKGESLTRYRKGHPLAELRSEALAGRVDLVALEQEVARVMRHGEQRELCPACVARDAVTRSGLCRVCHMRALAQAMQDERDYRDAARLYEAARQRRHREHTK